MGNSENQDRNDLQRELGISRRGLIKRGAIVGGTLVWAVPVIQSLSPPAFAQIVSPVRHFCCHCYNANAHRSTITSTSGYCLSDGGFFPDGHNASEPHCEEHCTSLGFDTFVYNAGPDPYGCMPVHPNRGGGCVALEGEH
jgi:hypothetical protein